MIGFLDIIRQPIFIKKRFGDCTLPPFSGKKPIQLGPIDGASPYLWKSE
jgi:hypothetical protein